MASSYVNDLRLNEMATGDASGSWGTNTNTNLGLIGEALGFGTEAITTNADTHASTIADGATDPIRAIFIKYTGTLDSACTITIGPNTVNKFCFIHNATSGSQSIIISQGSGANVTIATGQTKGVYLDGAGSGAAVVDAFATLSVVDLLVDDDLTVTDDASIGGDLDVVGVAAAATFEPDGDTAAGDNAAIGYTAAEGLILTGQGSTGDVTIKNDADALVAHVPTGTTGVTFAGAIDVSGTSNLDVIDVDGAANFAADVTIASGADLLTASAGVGNVLVGPDTGASIASGGNNNVMIGDSAGKFATTAVGSIFVGPGAGLGITGTKLTGNGNIAIGSNAGAVLQGAAALNVLIGAECGDAITVGSNSVAIGFRALGQETGGQDSVAIGTDALATQNFTTAGTRSGNVAVGLNAGKSITTGTANTFIGGFCGDGTDDGVNNVAVGNTSLSGNCGNNNTAVGEGALAATTGQNNQCFGNSAGAAITSGNYNTVVGNHTGNGDGIDIRTLENRIVLADGQGNVGLYIDNASQAFVGDMALQTDGANLNVNVTGTAMGLNVYQDNSSDTILCKLRHARANTGNSALATMIQFCRSDGAERGSIKVNGIGSTSFNTSSDYRLKENVDYNWDATTRLKQLKPARFNWIADADTTVDGFLAHEAATVVPDAVIGVKDATHVVENVVLSASDEVISQGTPEDYWTTRKADILYTEDDTLPDGKSVGDVKEAAKFPSDSKWVAKHSIPNHQQIDHSKIVPLLVKTIQELEARITALEG